MEKQENTEPPVQVEPVSIPTGRPQEKTETIPTTPQTQQDVKTNK